MTVAELIERLRTFPPDWRVVITTGESYAGASALGVYHADEATVVIWPDVGNLNAEKAPSAEAPGA